MADSQLRKDPVTQRWVVISPGRAEVPQAAVTERPRALGAEACPFCPGREAETGAEIYVQRDPGSAPNRPGWHVRVVADRRPIFHIEGGLERSAEGMYDAMNAIGAHEILVESPEHTAHWGSLEAAQIERVLRACRERMLDLRNDKRFRHVIWVKTDGMPGSVFQHAHSHIVASPIVPWGIEEELKGFSSHRRWKERCVLCDVLKQEMTDGRRLVLREGGVVGFTPYAPRFAYEMWIVPLEHSHDFTGTRPALLRDLARALQGLIRRMRGVLGDPPFSLVLHASPVGEFTREEYHWHLELVPRPPQLVGLEWGTGIHINPVPPELAAERLRGAGG
jgi:UDPglucose--hexose-1-phosphate uridylyltransferase